VRRPKSAFVFDPNPNPNPKPNLCSSKKQWNHFLELYELTLQSLHTAFARKNDRSQEAPRDQARKNFRGEKLRERKNFKRLS
jgi:hypothetical protein